MNATVVIYGSSTGTCEAIAEKIAQKLGCEAVNVQNLSADVVNKEKEKKGELNDETKTVELTQNDI